MAWYDEYDAGEDIWSPRARTSSNWDFLNPTGTNQAGASGATGKANWFDSMDGGGGDFGASGYGRSLATQPASITTRSRQMDMPEYDYGPMTRYQEYLKSEPDRADFKPSGVGRFLNAASAGLAGYQSGDINQALKVGEYLNERPYAQALKQWQGKGGRFEADAKLADTRYRNQVERANKAADNARADRLAAVTEAGLTIQQANLALRIEEASRNGFQQFTSNDGTIHLMRPDGKGGMTDIATGQPAIQQTAAAKALERSEALKESRRQHDTASGSSRLSASTSVANNLNSIFAADRRAADAGARSDWQFGVSEARRAGGETTAAERDANRPVQRGVASSIDSPKRVLKAFETFDDSRLGGVDGNEYVPSSLETTNPTKFKEVMRDIGKKRGLSEGQMIQEWEEFKGAMSPYVRRARKPYGG